MSDSAADNKADREAREAAEGEPRQTVSRMPADEETGPYFPSGMSAPEAALAGATADLDDDTVAKIDEARASLSQRRDDES